MKPHPSICLTTALLFLAVTRSTINAEESAVNPAGTWKLSVVTTNTQAHHTAQTLKLKLASGTLTGTLSYNSGPVVNGKAPASELPITDAKLQGSEISFNFTHPPASGNGPNATYNYLGNISSDTIKGTVTEEWMGHTLTRSWEAKRFKE